MATAGIGQRRQRSIVSRLHVVTVLIYVLLTLGMITMVFPFFWMTVSAFKQPQELMAYPPIWFPAHPSLNLLRRIWTEINFQRYFANSLFVTVTSTVAVLFTSAFVGYVLAKYEFWGKSALFLSIVATMMIPWPVLLIPQYLIALRLRLLNTYWALIVPALYSSFSIFLVRQYMHSVPNELLDAARIDGSSEPGIFLRIVLPLITPVLAALGIVNFMGSWDSFLWPLITLNSESLYTVPLGLASFTNKQWSDYAAINAGALISVVPVLVVFLIFQRYFIEGIALTGMRG